MSLLVLVLPLANDKMKIIIPIDDLIEYFNLKQLSDRTIKEYGVYYDKFLLMISPRKESINF